MLRTLVEHWSAVNLRHLRKWISSGAGMHRCDATVYPHSANREGCEEYPPSFLSLSLPLCLSGKPILTNRRTRVVAPKRPALIEHRDVEDESRFSYKSRRGTRRASRVSAVEECRSVPIRLLSDRRGRFLSRRSIFRHRLRNSLPT